MGSIRIRRGVVADATALAALAASTFRDAFGADNSPEDLQMHLASSYGPAQQSAELTDPNMITLLAHDGDVLLAFAQLRRGVAPACVTAVRAVEVRRLYVDKAVHGKGVAQALMAATFAVTADFDGMHVWLSVWERNPRAMAFYRKMGFADVGETHFYVGSDRQTDRVFVAALPAAVSLAT